MVIRPEPLTRDAFAPYGAVLEIEGRTPRLINQGNTQKFEGLGSLVRHDEGGMTVSVYRSRAAMLPVSINMLERHPLGSQAFIPLHNRPFPVVVANAVPAPRSNDIRLFLTNGLQGIILAPGTWHHYQLSLERSSDYVVIDREGDDGNLEEYRLTEPVLLQL